MKGMGKVPITSLLDNSVEVLEKRLDKLSNRIRVASPGIIKSFDSSKQTVTVQIAITERISLGGSPFQDMKIPVLLDVPIYMPRAGNFVLTVPVTVGDECLVIFGDRCIDSWWESGGVGNQMDNRNHDLSDGFAIIGVWSQPNVISDYSTDSAVLRNLNNDCYVEVKDNDINIKTPMKVTIDAGSEVEIKAAISAKVEALIVEVKASVSATVEAPITTITATTATIDATTVALVCGSLSVAGKGGATPPVQITGGVIQITGGSVAIAGSTTIESRAFLSHTHSGVETGGGVTGGVV